MSGKNVRRTVYDMNRIFTRRQTPVILASAKDGRIITASTHG